MFIHIYILINFSFIFEIKEIFLHQAGPLHINKSNQHRILEPSPSMYIYKTLLQLIVKEHCRREVEKVYKPEGKGGSCEIVSPSDFRSDTS